MQPPFLSIIVPVFNVEKYIEKCISSIVNQGVAFQDVELIIVNDGTKDRSIELIQPIIAGLPNVVLINQENAGLSVARNVGLRAAKGEYVWFVDSDDTIAPQALPILFQKMESRKDCYGLNLLWVNESDGKQNAVGVWPLSASELSGVDFMKKMNHLTPVQRYVVKRNILLDNQLFFFPKILHEDLEYVPRLLYYVKGVDVVEEPLYYYLRRVSGSITANISERNIVGLVQGVISIDHFTEESVAMEYRAIYREKVYELFQHFIHKYTEYIDNNNDWSLLYLYLVDIKKAMKNIKVSLPFKEQLHVNCFLISPRNYVRYRKSRLK